MLFPVVHIELGQTIAPFCQANALSTSIRSVLSCNSSILSITFVALHGSSLGPDNRIPWALQDCGFHGCGILYRPKHVRITPVGCSISLHCILKVQTFIIRIKGCPLKSGIALFVNADIEFCAKLNRILSLTSDYWPDVRL